MSKRLITLFAVAVVSWWVVTDAGAGDQPVAIFHAFNESYADVAKYVCEVGKQGYSHIQIAPAQKSNPAPNWWARYQPVDYSVIEGRGSEQDLKRLTDTAHGCNVKVIADVVFNHMATMPQYADLHFPQFSPEDFHRPPCEINYNDGNTITEVVCWLGGLPDLDQNRKSVQDAQKGHLTKLLALGIDGFRFDAAKHMAPEIMKLYLDFVNDASHGKTWNYIEVIQDNDTKAERYLWVAAETDFPLYNSMKRAFSFGGNLRSLRVPEAINDTRSVVFGENHDTIRSLNQYAINPYDDRSDSYLATAYVLARESGTPLVLGEDNLVPYIRSGARFRQIMKQRGTQGLNVRENVLGVLDSPTVLVMERGSEGFFVENKGATKLDQPVLDLTLTNLEGCYRELRNDFTVAVERSGTDYKKYVTRWGTRQRGGIEVQPRDALYFVRESWDLCR
jgi:alpha-amylase